MAGNIVGAIKRWAAAWGITPEEYQAKLDAGLKWCTGCKQWQVRDFFDQDRSRGDGLATACISCRRVALRRHRITADATQVDRAAAVSAVWYAIKKGRLASPRALPCIRCGGQAEVYHHHLGYGRRHRLDVQAICRSCHVLIHWGR